MSELKTDADVVVSGCVASPSSSSLDTMDDSKENEAGGSLSTSSLKRKRSGPESPGPDIVVQDGSHETTHSVFLFLLFKRPIFFDVVNPIFR